MYLTCDQYEPIYSTKKAFSSCIIALLFVSFLFYDPVWYIFGIPKTRPFQPSIYRVNTWGHSNPTPINRVNNAISYTYRLTFQVLYLFRNFRTRSTQPTTYRVNTWGCVTSTPIIGLREFYFWYNKTSIHVQYLFVIVRTMPFNQI